MVEVTEILEPVVTANEGAAREASEDATADLALFEASRNLDTASAYELYLSNFPKGHFSRDAKRELQALSNWYLSPFRRGNISKTYTAAGVLVGLIGAVAGAVAVFKDPLAIGVAEEVHAGAAKDLEEATARASSLETEIAALRKSMGEPTEEVSSRPASAPQGEGPRRADSDRFEALPFDRLFDNTTVLEHEGAWAVATANNRLTCFVATSPVGSEAIARDRSSFASGDPLFVLALIDGREVPVVALSPGFSPSPDVGSTLRIGEHEYSLSNSGDWASDWDSGTRVQFGLSLASLRGEFFEARSRSVSGTEVRDTYSADGFNAGWAAAKRLCDR
ncbi:MAG: hypothetical protein AAFR47_06065 [Pseudomonadota bacterium]